MREVAFEMRKGEGWHTLGSVCEVEPGGSISSYDLLGRRHVYHFGWLPDGAGPGVWESMLGVDEETGPFRKTTTVGFKQLADLTEGPHELEWRQPAKRMTAKVRFRLVPEP